MPLEMLQPFVGIFGVILLLYWTAERVRGDGDDPSIAKQYSSDTGQSSILISGIHLVAIVALGAAWGLRSVIPEGRMTIAAVVLVGVVGAHYLYEKEERR